MSAVPAFALSAKITVRDWQFLARAKYGARNWETAARRWAEEHGGAVVLMGNDDVVLFSRQDDGKVVKLTQRSALQ